MSDGDHTWLATSQELKYLLGEFVLGTVRFPALVADTHFTSIAKDPGKLRPPTERLSAAIEAAVIRSHPAEVELARLTVLPDCVRYVPFHYDHHYVELCQSFAEYLKKFSAKPRRNLQRTVRKFAEFSGGTICWREFRHVSEMDEFHSLARSVSAKTYQEKLLQAGLPDTESFRRRLVELAGEERVRGYILFHEDRPMAFAYCAAKEDILIYHTVGYDPAFQQWSPGTVLLYLLVERMFAERRYRILDFGEGEAHYKQFFANSSIRCADLFYFRRTSRNLLLLCAHVALQTVSELIAAAMDRLGWKSYLKKLLRARA